MSQQTRQSPVAVYHLPGLFEFYTFYREFLSLFREYRDWFYPWCRIGSIYGAPADCLWGGGRVGFGEDQAVEVAALLREHGISARLTFSNSLLRPEHLKDKKCNNLCRLFSHYDEVRNGIILHSDLLLEYLQKNWPDLYLVSSTTKVLTRFEDFHRELQREEFAYVVPDFRLNPRLQDLDLLPEILKGKVEFLCNECCSFTCPDRRACYEAVSRKSLGEEGPEYLCRAPEGRQGYRFSRAMKNPGFISVEDIQNIYLPLGFTNFKIEGRGLGSAVLLEFLLHYLTRPEYHLMVREELYLDSMLDLF